MTDKPLVSALANLFAGRTVVGLGDGRGEYRKQILGTGKVQTYDAYDGAPNINNLTGGQVIWSFIWPSPNGAHQENIKKNFKPLIFRISAHVLL